MGGVFNNSFQLWETVLSGLPVTLCSWGEVRLSCRPPSCLSRYTHTSLSARPLISLSPFSLPQFFLSLFQKGWQLQTKQGLWADWHFLPVKEEHLTRLTPYTAHHTHTHTQTLIHPKQNATIEKRVNRPEFGGEFAPWRSEKRKGGKMFFFRFKGSLFSRMHPVTHSVRVSPEDSGPFSLVSFIHLSGWCVWCRTAETSCQGLPWDQHLLGWERGAADLRPDWCFPARRTQNIHSTQIYTNTAAFFL